MNKSKAILELEKEFDVEISGPFSSFSSPYGIALPDSKRETWYLTRQRTPEEIKQMEEKLPDFFARTKTEMKPERYKKFVSEKTFGKISRFCCRPRTFIIPQLYPPVSFNSLRKAIGFLKENDGKLVYCS